MLLNGSAEARGSGRRGVATGSCVLRSKTCAEVPAAIRTRVLSGLKLAALIGESSA